MYASAFSAATLLLLGLSSSVGYDSVILLDLPHLFIA